MSFDDFEDEEIRDNPLAVFELERVKILREIPPYNRILLIETERKLCRIRDLIKSGDFSFTYRSLLKEQWLNYLSVRELEMLMKKGRHFNHSNINIETSSKAIPRNCHLIALLDWMDHPWRKIYTGVVDNHYAHSWTVYEDGGVLYEPTTAGWDGYYFGFEIEPAEHFLSIQGWLISQLETNKNIPDRERYRKVLNLLKIADTTDAGEFEDLAPWAAKRFS